MSNLRAIKSLRLLFCVSACLAVLSIGAWNRVAFTQPDSKPARRELKIQPLTLAGEKLTYEIKYSRFPIYATVGEITFELLGKTPEPFPQNLIEDSHADFSPKERERLIHLRAVAVAKGLLIKLFGIKAQDRFETLVTERDFSARLSFKRIQEGKKDLSQTTILDPQKTDAAYSVRDFSKAEEPPKDSTVKAASGTLDLLSAIYYLRLPKLKSGESFTVPLNDEGHQYEIEVVVGKTEKLKTDLGEFKTIRVEPKIFGEGKLISKEGELALWLTDDERRIPVKAVAKYSAGTVTANLIRMEIPRSMRAKDK